VRTLWRALRYPRLSLYAFDGREAVRRELAGKTWGWLTAVAVAGTVVYGSALPRPSALRLLAATALSWCLFGPALVWVTRKRALTCAHACLVTMTYGIAVLAVGAGISRLLSPGSLFHLAWVALSNAIMALALVRQLEVLDVRPWRTLLPWVVVLDGAGIALFGGLP
jgi:hypothetical protein